MVNQVYLMKTIASTALPARVQQPRYDRQQLRSRIVHFGFGAFHRAHQALLTNRVLNEKGGDWGICEISLFSGDVLMSQLRAQDHLFTVLEKGAEGNEAIIVGAVHECLNAKLDSLPAIIAVGYRTNSTRATQFRQWATKVLDTVTRQGYVLDKDRLINGQIFDEDYFDHLVSEIQEICASERRFYQKITDIYATAVDYSVDSKTTKDFL